MIAKKCLNKSVLDSVKKYLGHMDFKEASVWMDEVRSEKSYDHLKPWHYINVGKGQNYVRDTNINVVSQIRLAIQRSKGTFKNTAERYEQINFYLKVLFHLIGDIHQPLHCGYGEDKGGNAIEVNYFGKRSNLHHIWDTDMIEDANIGLRSCFKKANRMSKEEKEKVLTLDPETWMKESRDLLPQVYMYDKGIGKEYLEQNKSVIECRLVEAGIRLAYVLHTIFS